MLGLLLGIVVIVGLALAADLPKVVDAVRGFEWGWLPLILGLTSFNHLLRFIKWHYYLRRVNIHNIGWDDSLSVSWRLRDYCDARKNWRGDQELVAKSLAGACIARTLPVVADGQLSDALACALLASVGVFAYPNYWPAFLAILAVMIGGIVVIQIRRSLVINHRLRSG